jgi:hypothetical protein
VKEGRVKHKLRFRPAAWRNLAKKRHKKEAGAPAWLPVTRVFCHKEEEEMKRHNRFVWLLVVVGLVSVLFVDQAQAQGYQTISDGQTVYQSLGYYGDDWFFVGDAGDHVTVAMNSTQIDSFLEVFGPNGNLICSNDDGGGNFNALILECRLPQSGWYKILSSSFDGSLGPYYLTLDIVQPQLPQWPRPVVEQPGWHITYNVVVNESVQSWGGDQWTFDGSRGDWVRINMRSSNMDTYLELYDPFGNLLAQDDDSGDGTNARIYVDSLPFNGVYTIVARGFDGDTGSYQLQLE